MQIKHNLSYMIQKLNAGEFLLAKEKFDFGDIHKIVSLLGEIKPIKDGKSYSALKTLESLDDYSDDIRALVYITGTYFRSNYSKLKFTTTANSRWGPLTPLGLYAFKEKYGISYNEWMVGYEQHSSLALLMGPSLQKDNELGAAHFRMNYTSGEVLPILHYDAILAAEGGELAEAVRQYTCRVFGKPSRNAVPMKISKDALVKIMGKELAKEWDVARQNYNNATMGVRMMAFQANVAQEQFRIPDAMILNWNDWTFVPEDYEQPVVQTAVKFRIPGLT